ncbi:ankyrin repeat-containing domain protein [Mycena floridula]|nr:ankyrin repeat-containing domain protein [Mycena floridula]
MILQKVERKLDLAASRTGKVIQMLKWPLDKAEVTALLQQVERVKTFVMLAIHSDHVALSRVIHQGIQQISTRIDHVTDKVSEIAEGAKQIQAHNMNVDLRAFSEWLSPIDFQATQENFLAKCAPGTGHWLPAEVKFEHWTAGDIRILWCPGSPGVGKTMLASTAVDHLRNQLAIQVWLLPAYSSTTTPQALKAKPTSLAVLTVLEKTLQAQIGSYSRVYLVVDALDECPIGIRDNFISTIRSLTESGHLNVLITSRDISTIAQEFLNETRINVRAHDEDILSYISYRIEHEKRLKTIVKEDAVLKKDIVTQVIEKAAGMFLLVRLHLDSLANKNNRHALRLALATLPQDIHRSYDETMTRILAQGKDDANLACQVFLWLTYAKRQLTVEELQYALAISPGMTEMNPDAITDIGILTSVCAGLVIIERDHQKGDLFPRFVHYTTQEYFQHQESQTYFRHKETESYFELSGKFLSSNLFAHFHIVVTCITYMAFEGLKLDYPLLRYSAELWGYHAGQCENMLCSTSKMAALLQNLLEDGFKVPSSLSSRIQEFDLHYHSSRVLGNFGLLQLTSMLVHRGVPINSKSREKRTVLFYAVQKGHVDMVKWLLGEVNEMGLSGQQLFNINDADWTGKTLLHHAIDRQHPTIAEFLLSLPGINPNLANNFGRTPLSYAAESSCPRILDLISQQEDVNPNSCDSNGNPPLYYAIDSKRVETVRILLRLPDIYVGPFQPSPHGHRVDLDSPLKVAAVLGYVDIMDLLLKHPDTDPNWKGDGPTPLAYASMHGHLEVVNILLQHSNIQTNLMSGPRDSEWILPPLTYAVRHRYQRIVERLLQHPDVDVNCRGFYGRPPLSWAASWGCVEAVESLLRHPHIQPDIPDQMGMTPLIIAAMSDRESSFHVLFQSHKVTRDLVSLENVSLLAHAARGGNRNIIHRVLELSSSSGCKDCRLCTPMSYAAVEGYQDIVELLLEQDDLKPQPRHPLPLWEYRPAAKQLLLPAQDNLDPSSRHRQHFTTLIDYALRWGYTGISALFRQHVETEDSLGVDSWK